MKKRVLSSRDVYALDRKANRLGLSTLVLMENAGRAVSDVVIQKTKNRSQKILVLCGKGNNGADAMVAARFLTNRGYQVIVLLCAKVNDLKNESQIQWNLVKHWSIKRFSEPQSSKKLSHYLSWCDVVVDGLLGVGIRLPLRANFQEWIEKVNSANKCVVSVDIPSGLDADGTQSSKTVIQANTTVTFHGLKKGLQGASCAGKVVIADISLAPHRA